MTRLLVLLAVVLGPTAFAQSPVPTGDWAGTIQWRGAEPIALAGTLEECAEGLKLTLGSDDGAYETDEVVRVATEAEAPRLRFDLANTRRGYTLACTAAPQEDGAFAGRCRTADGSWARLTLQPPSRSLIGCSE